jgi:hypothetical protein
MLAVALTIDQLSSINCRVPIQFKEEAGAECPTYFPSQNHVALRVHDNVGISYLWFDRDALEVSMSLEVVYGNSL